MWLENGQTIVALRLHRDAGVIDIECQTPSISMLYCYAHMAEEIKTRNKNKIESKKPIILHTVIEYINT